MQINLQKLPDYKKIASQIKKARVSVTPEEIERLRLEKERIEKERVRREILERICGESLAEIPQDILEREKTTILESIKQQASQILRISFEDYLKKINKTEKELSDSLLPEAKKRLMSFLVLRAIAEKENIQVQDEAVQKEMEAILGNFPDAQNIDKNQLKDYTEETLRNEKTFQFLENL